MVATIVNKIKKIKYIEYKLLFLIVLLGFLLRLYKIDNPVADWHSWRQADTASVSRVYVDEGINLLFPRYHDVSTIQTGKFNPQGFRFVEFPLYNVIHAYLAGTSAVFSFEVWGRLVSIISSIVSGIFLYYLGARFINIKGGLLASFFFLFIPFNIYFSRVILPEPLAVALGLASLVLFVSYSDTKKNWKLYLSGICLSLGILVKPFVLFYSVPMLYLIIRKYGLKKIFNEAGLLIPLLIFIDIVLIPFILWRTWISYYPEGIPFWKWAFNGDKIRFRPSFWRWIFGERVGHLILGSWGLVPFVLGLLAKARSNFDKIFFLGALIYLFLIATANVRHDYYQTLIIPAVSLILARGSLWMWETKEFNRKFSRWVLIFSLGVGFITGALQIKEFYNINHKEIIIAGNDVDRIIPKNALVVAPYNADTAFLYQTKRWGWPYVDRSIEDLIKNGADYYVSVNFDEQTVELMEKYKLVKKTDIYVILDLNKPLK
jgi:hypothetical protein